MYPNRPPWATWLELAAAGARGESGRIEVRPIAMRRGSCYVVCLDDRPVRASDGCWTILRDMSTAYRFLGGLDVQGFVQGEKALDAVTGAPHECWLLDRGDLMRCDLCERLPSDSGADA